MKHHFLLKSSPILFSLSLIISGVPGQIPTPYDTLNQYFNISHSEFLLLGDQSSNNHLEITGKEILKGITEKKYLVIECEQEKDESGIIHLQFFKSDHSADSIESVASLYSKIGLLPHLRTYMVFPMSYLDGQQIFIPRFPRQLKGVVFGNRIEPKDLAKIKIYAASGEENEGIKIFSIFLSDKLPDFDTLPEKKVVDRFGQWSSKNWKDKIISEKQWKNHSDHLRIITEENAALPKEFSKFGGWKAKRFDSTGFFNTHYDGHRWWFTDPHGYAFLSFGMDVVNPGVPAVLSGNKDLYSLLPEKNGIYLQAYGNPGNLETIDFLRINLMRIFGEDWYENWKIITRNKLLSANFNTIGNWSDKNFIQTAEIPYVLPMAGFPETETRIFRDFPDVFSPEYRKKAEIFATQLEKYKNDPYLIGYFLRNEPQWAFGERNLAFEMLNSDNFSYTKAVLALWLQQKYEDPDSLSSKWSMAFDSFTDLLNLKLKEYPSDSCRNDLWEFSKIMVQEYIRVITEETRKVAPDHLNLGMRYSHISSELLYIAGESFDVFSINGYHSPGPPETKEIYEKSGKPVLIGEFHFGATDQGLPSTGLRGVKDQKQRGIAYRYYLEQGFSRPEVIGIHYFQWMDQAIMGRFDGENYNIGFNDILYQSYEKLFEQAKKAHLNIYPVATGEKKAFRKKPVPAKAIAF